MSHFSQGSKLEKQCSTPEHTREFPEGTITPLLISRETVSVMGTLKHSFQSKKNPRVASEAVIAPMSMSGQHVCKSHEVLGRPISHIICLHKPNKNRFTVVPLEDIIDICVYIKFSDCDVSYAANFSNHIEKD